MREKGDTWESKLAFTGDGILTHRVYDAEGRFVAETNNDYTAALIATEHNELLAIKAAGGGTT